MFFQKANVNCRRIENLTLLNLLLMCSCVFLFFKCLNDVYFILFNQMIIQSYNLFCCFSLLLYILPTFFGRDCHLLCFFFGRDCQILLLKPMGNLILLNPRLLVFLFFCPAYICYLCFSLTAIKSLVISWPKYCWHV